MAIRHNQRSIVDFRSRLKGGGARSNLFEVQMAFPDFAKPVNEALNDIPFLVKAAEIPASNIGNIPVPFRGRVLPVAGDRTFDPWTVTIINNDFKISIINNSNCPRIKGAISSDGKNTPSIWNRNGS